jgi:hypothetical protein
MKLEKLKAEYVAKLSTIDKIVETEKQLLADAREAKDPADEIAVRSADIRGLNKVRQCLVQIISDLEDL